jgi:hypothetical protein
MACILTLMGSVLGFVAAITALVLFQISFATALIIWTCVGIACVIAGLVLAHVPQPQQDAMGPEELA